VVVPEASCLQLGLLAGMLAGLLAGLLAGMLLLRRKR
jgi:thiamine transporter ThiT